MTKSWLGLIGLLLVTSALADNNTVQTQPLPSTTTGGNASSTITTTNTFQLVWAATPNSFSVPVTSGTAVRHGCSIQNNGTHNMYVSEGQGKALASLTNSWVLAAGNTFSCNFNGVVLTGEIDITGTSGDAFFASQF